jgi:hypothetical protein
MRMKRHAITVALTAALSACGPGENDPGPGGVTAGEAKALDQAAAMLDGQRSPADGGARVPAPLPPDPDASAAPAKD